MTGGDRGEQKRNVLKPDVNDLNFIRVQLDTWGNMFPLLCCRELKEKRGQSLATLSVWSWNHLFTNIKRQSELGLHNDGVKNDIVLSSPSSNSINSYKLTKM